jgi:hypothetical protein
MCAVVNADTQAIDELAAEPHRRANAVDEDRRWCRNWSALTTIWQEEEP